MIGLRDSILKNFPQEQVLNELDVEIESLQNNLGQLPFGSFKPKNIVVPCTKVIETSNYWFVDRRMKLADGRDYILTTAERTTGGTPDYQIINLILIPAFFVLIFWQFVGLWSFAVGLVILLLQLTYLLLQQKYYAQGWMVAIYDKQWVKVNKNSESLDLEIFMPKYSKDAVWKRLINSNILDFIGITVSTTALKFHYKFKIIFGKALSLK